MSNTQSTDDSPETIPAENFVPDQPHEAQLVQGPLDNTATPVTASEDASASLQRTAAAHPELQQMATMSGGVSNVANATKNVGTAIGSTIAKLSRPGEQTLTEIPANIAKTPSPRPSWMGQNPSASDAGTRFLGNINPRLSNLKAEGGEIESPDTIAAQDFTPDSKQNTTSDSDSPDTIPAENFTSDEDKYGTAGQQFETAAEHAASSATFGLSTKAETALGVKPEDIRGRTEENPVSGVVGSLTGLLVPGAPEAKALSKVGELGAGLVRGSTALSKIGASAVKGAIENSLFQAGDEVSKNFTQDPNQSAQTAISDIGLSGVLGGALGAGFGSIPALWEGSKASKFVDELRTRLNEHLTNPDLATEGANNLDKFYTDTTKGSDSLFRGSYDENGARANNVKDQALAKLVPPMNETIQDEGIGKVTNHFLDKIEEMKADTDTFQPKFTKALEKDFSKWQEIANNPNSSSYDIFKASEDLKRTLQERSRIGIPIDNSNPAFDSIKSLKDSAAYLRKSLENTDVWGDAGKFQRDTNQAYSKFLNPLKEFNRSFTTVLEGKPTIDPDKVQTYINQASRDKGIIRGEKLQNYLDAADKFRDAVNDAHESIGVAGPFETKSADAVNTLTQKLTPGAKAADSLVKGALSKSGSDATGAIGGLMAGWPGYMLGKHVAGPVVDSVMPTLMHPILGSAADGTGLKHAIEYISAFSKGETDLNRGIKNVFKAGKETIPSSLISTDKEKSKLDEHLKSLAENPEPLTGVGGSTSHYLPEHGIALAKTAMTAVNYLNSQRPQAPKVSPLDTPSKPDPMQVAKWDRTLSVAQQPLSVLSGIKNGTLQPNDVKTLSTLYPDLYSKISQKLVTEISGRTENSEPIPYTTKMGMSLFLGKAMDSTMLPESIMAAQPAVNIPTQSPQAKPKKPTAASAKAMETVANSAMTPGQARASYRSQVRA